ncbi:MAG: transporter substrate-binding domain-containing protein, partial [Candidatus Omnitrophota bacterium]
MNVLIDKSYPGFLFVWRQASGFFYFRRRACAIVILFFILLSRSCAWALSAELDKVLLPEEKTWLKQHDEWRVGVDPAWPPVEMIGDDGVYSGMGADYIRLLAERLDVTLNIQPGLSWSEVIDKAKKGEIDILPAVAHTFERSAYLNFSDIYLDIPLVIITRSDKKGVDSISDLSGKVVSVAESYPIQEWLLKDHPKIILHPYRNVSYALDAVAFGQADAYVGDIASASYIIDRLNISNLHIVSTTSYSFADRVGVRKDWPELVIILNKALATITPQEHGAIKNKWITFKYRDNFWRMVNKLIPFMIGFVALGLFSVNLFLGNIIRKRKMAEYALAKAERRLKDIVYSSVDWVWELDAGGRYIYTSDTVTPILGYSPKELIGKTPFDLMLPEEAARLKPIFAGIVAGKKPIKDLENINISKDGKIVCLLTNGVPVLDEKGVLLGYRGVDKDITERTRVRDALRRSEENFRLMVERAPNAIIVFSGADEKVEYVNPRFTQIFG